MYLSWYLLACRMRVSVVDSGLRYSVGVTSFDRQLTPLFVNFTYAELNPEHSKENNQTEGYTTGS